ncbi:MAG: polyamine aminopropyltransferase, partial [Brachymonas sp.]|nr:polyamine aminopropyltransferase [Brachymonas sp.]
SQVLTVDYLGALAVSIAFPLLLMPHLGLLRTGLLFGLLNVVVGLWTLWLFRYQIAAPTPLWLLGGGVMLALLTGFAQAGRVTTAAEAYQFQAPVVLSADSPYQRIAITRRNGQLRLYLNGNLQFAQSDEYRYHEALVHPAMSGYANGGAPRKVAVLGGGDGMAVREILKYPGVESITLIELDPNMTRLFGTDPLLTPLNANSLNHPKVRIVNADAFTWLQENDDIFDVIVVDFPDPTNFSVGKLFTNSFYSLLDSRLAQGGYAVVQTTSPLIARKSFWTVVQTIESVGLTATPYHAHVPSFGEWGFVIASRRPYRLPQQLPAELKFLDVKTLPQLFDFPPDMARVPAEVNRLASQVLVRTYEEEWGRVLK